MDDQQRADGYVAIFNKVGDKWEDFVPVDAKLHKDGTLHIGSCFLYRLDSGRWAWSLVGVGHGSR